MTLPLLKNFENANTEITKLNIEIAELKSKPSPPTTFSPKDLKFGSITGSGVFPTGLNNFQDGDIINAGDWNALENAIGTTTGAISSSTSVTLSLFHLTQPAIRGGTGAVLSFNKGDLLVGSSTPNVLGKLATSTDGYQLTQSSTAPFGVAWEVPNYGISSSTVDALNGTDTPPSATNRFVTEHYATNSERWVYAGSLSWASTTGSSAFTNFNSSTIDFIKLVGYAQNATTAPVSVGLVLNTVITGSRYRAEYANNNHNVLQSTETTYLPFASSTNGSAFGTLYELRLQVTQMAGWVGMSVVGGFAEDSSFGGYNFFRGSFQDNSVQNLYSLQFASNASSTGQFDIYTYTLK